MSHIIHEIIKLETEINLEKLRVKVAIKNGAIFEEIKKIILTLRELQKDLESCLANQ